MFMIHPLLFLMSKNFFKNKTLPDIHQMLHKKNINWEKLDPIFKNGTFIQKDGTITHNKEDYNSIKAMIGV